MLRAIRRSSKFYIMLRGMSTFAFAPGKIFTISDFVFLPLWTTSQCHLLTIARTILLRYVHSSASFNFGSLIIGFHPFRRSFPQISRVVSTSGLHYNLVSASFSFYKVFTLIFFFPYSGATIQPSGNTFPSTISCAFFRGARFRQECAHYLLTFG